MSAVVVLGAGPSGCVFATQMARFGHEVTLVERAAFPRMRLGESLTPGVPDLLASIDARDVLENCNARPVSKVLLNWDVPALHKDMSGSDACIVDRGLFDQGLLDHARRCGVRIKQPAQVCAATSTAQGWAITLEENGTREMLQADYMAHATGRGGAAKTRRYDAQKTICLYAYWQLDAVLPPQLHATGTGWAWGVPLPNGLYNTLFFMDAKAATTTCKLPLEARFEALLAQSDILREAPHAQRVGPVMASDATPYIDTDPINDRLIRLGDAALALDPVSSSGVQKCIQSALGAAVSANTVLRRPADAETAYRFYRDSLQRTAARHRTWTGEHYTAVARRFSTDFWHARARPEAARPPGPDSAGPRHLTTGRLQLCPNVAFDEAPCAEGTFARVKSAILHPGLDGPVSFLDGIEIAPLLRRLPRNMNGMQIARALAPEIPLQKGITLVAWLINKGIVLHVPD